MMEKEKISTDTFHRLRRSAGERLHRSPHGTFRLSAEDSFKLIQELQRTYKKLEQETAVRREAEKQFEQAQKKAKEAVIRSARLAALGELAAGVAHEINNPINGIINYSQIIADNSNGDCKLHDIAGRIIKEGDRIVRIVGSLLSFARAGDGEKRPVHIAEIMSDSLSLIETYMKKDGIKTIINIPQNLPEIIAQPQHMEQVFLNIMSNARYALNQKYPGIHKNKALQIICSEDIIDGHSYIRISFLDYGTGIPDEIMNKIMNPFFTTKPRGIGTGLGLGISRGIINDHGGKISIYSVNGEFTNVIIEIPAYGRNNSSGKKEGITRERELV